MCECGIVREGAFSDRGNTCGHLNRVQQKTRTESIRTDRCDTVRDCDGGYFLGIMKRLVFDTCDGIGLPADYKVSRDDDFALQRTIIVEKRRFYNGSRFVEQIDIIVNTIDNHYSGIRHHCAAQGCEEKS